MNYDFLSTEKLRPFWVRYVGIAFAFSTIIFSIYLKSVDANRLFGLSYDHLKPIFLFSLLLINAAKSKTEDERMSQIRLQITRFGYSFMIGILALILFAEATGGNQVSKDLMFDWIISIVTTQVLIFEAIKSSKILDFFEKHQSMFQLLTVLIVVLLMQINQWLW
jgi:hypothetical protein